MTLLKRLSVLGVAFTLSLTSIAQTAPKDIAMEKFDIEAFNSNKQGHDWSYTKPDGTKVRQWQTSKKDYQIEITPTHSAYKKIRIFNYEGKLIQASLRFYGFLTGISTLYDGNGNVIKEYNHDTDFAFSVDDFIKKMKDEYHVDITDTRQVSSVQRGYVIIDGQETPLYGIYVYDLTRSEGIIQTTAYLFNGNTGKLLYTIIADVEGIPSIFMEYENMLKNKKENNQ